LAVDALAVRQVKHGDLLQAEGLFTRALVIDPSSIEVGPRPSLTRGGPDVNLRRARASKRRPRPRL
jgi:hypothetical protein